VVLKGKKYRVYPNKTQQDLINKTLGCCRFVYNKGLERVNSAHNAGINLNYYDLTKQLTLDKKADYPFLKEVSNIPLQQSLRDLDRAFVNFFRHSANRPVFKSKRSSIQSYRTYNVSTGVKTIKIPKVGVLKTKQVIDSGRVHYATVERTSTGKYFVVLTYEFEPVKLSFDTPTEIGIDVGIKSFYTDSNGNTVPNPKFLDKSLRRLAKEQRSLARKKKRSNNYRKQKIKVAKRYEKIANQRNDFLQKESTKLINENQVICLEDLNVSGMLKNHNLARPISDSSWSRFTSMLLYKAEWYGNEIRKVNTFYPSSQLCHVCGYKNSDIKNLSIRSWVCPSCNTKHDRDVNAACNILNEGKRLKTT